MKLNKVFVIVVLMLTFALSIFTNVYAQENMRGTVELVLEDPSSYKVGEEIIVNVSINVTGFDGILLFYADVNYDKTVLKYEGVNPSAGWVLTSEDENVYIEKSNTKDATGKICSLKFKVLKDTQDTTIKLESIDASGANGSVHYLYENVNSPSLVIRGADSTRPEQPIQGEKPTQPIEGTEDIQQTEDVKPTQPIEGTEDVKPTQPTEVTQETKPAQSTVQAKPDSNKTDNTQSKDNAILKNKLPKTGYSIFEDIVMSVMLVVLVIIIIKYIRRLKNTKE